MKSPVFLYETVVDAIFSLAENEMNQNNLFTRRVHVTSQVSINNHETFPKSIGKVIASMDARKKNALLVNIVESRVALCKEFH